MLYRKLMNLKIAGSVFFSDSIDPPVIHKDIEKYLIKSSNRTCDDQKMAFVTISTYMSTSIVKKNTYTR